MIFLLNGEGGEDFGQGLLVSESQGESELGTWCGPMAGRSQGVDIERSENLVW